MADDDLKEFERSLRQLELIADTSSPKKPATRNQEERPYRLNSDINDRMLEVPQPVGNLTEHQETTGNENSDRRYYRTHGGSTRKPSNSELMQDSVINSAGNVYEKMKSNMQKALDRQQRANTLK